MDILIYKAISNNDIAEIKKLFTEYAESLNFDLCFQGFDEEISTLPGKYTPPTGILYIAKVDNNYAGCIALRKLEDVICEMKRLYVRPKFRHLGLGRNLCDKLIEIAKSMGYEKMRLDTIGYAMQSAIKLYKSYGFYEIPPYYNNPE